MLFATHSGFGAASTELIDLKDRVDRCIRLKNSNGFTNDDGGASSNLFCTSTVIGNEPLAVLRKIEKLSFLDDVDNQLMFDIARTLIRQWRAMGMAGGIDGNETEVRRIAAQKLLEVGALSPDVAILQLSGAAREEADGLVLLRIIEGLKQLISKTTATNIRTEALTSLGALADPLQANAGVRIAAQTALKILDNKLGLTLEIGPAVVTPTQPAKKPLPTFVVPLVAITGTAIVSAGVLWYIFGRRSEAHALSAPGPLRRRAEAQRRRRRATR